MSEENKTKSAVANNYHLKDHLGNVRLSFKPASSSPNITQEDFYYPFGLRISRLVNGEGIKYLYNGKEMEDKYDLYWYHEVYPDEIENEIGRAREYDPMIARWLSMDPADEFHSPYCYVGNDPVNLVDPDGMQVSRAYSFSYWRDKVINWFRSKQEIVENKLKKVGKAATSSLYYTRQVGIPVAEYSAEKTLKNSQSILKAWELEEKAIGNGITHSQAISKVGEAIKFVKVVGVVSSAADVGISGVEFAFNPTSENATNLTKAMIINAIAYINPACGIALMAYDQVYGLENMFPNIAKTQEQRYSEPLLLMGTEKY